MRHLVSGVSLRILPRMVARSRILSSLSCVSFLFSSLACSSSDGDERPGPSTDNGGSTGESPAGGGSTAPEPSGGGTAPEPGNGGGAAVDLSIVDPPAGAATVTVSINSAQTHPISENIYGMNVGQMEADEVNALVAEVGFTVGRAGGNRFSAYNWETNASNAGSDWFFHNDGYLSASDVPGAAVDGVLQAANAGSISALLTLQLNDYVAADKDETDVRETADFLTSRFLANVLEKGSAFSTTPDTTDGTVYQDEFLNWAKETYPDSNLIVSLDNEPDLWSSTWEIFWPTAPTYDDVVERNLAAARMVKMIVPSAEVAGFASFGWYGWETLTGSDDYATKGEFLDYYLDQCAAAEATDGQRLIDYVDLHWYPEARGDDSRITDGATTAGAVEARVQAPRSLWDPTYVEDSWITNDSIGGEAIQLLPRIQGQIDEHYPGTKLAIAEWDYGANNHVSGAIAAADVLGIFGREGVGQSSHWFAGDDQYFTYGAYQVYRNYDGQGGKFGSVGVEATTSDPVASSVYAALDPDDPSMMKVVLINKRDAAQIVDLDIAHDQELKSAQVYVLDASAADTVNLTARPQARASVRAVTSNQFKYEMPPMSVSLLVASTSDNFLPTQSWPAPVVLGEAEGATFDADAEGWSITGTSPIDGASTLTWDGAEGDPAPGSLSVHVPFTDRGQQVQVGPASGALNLIDNKLSVKVKRTGDFDGGVMVYFVQGEWWGAHGWTLLNGEDWVTIDVSPAAVIESAASLDPNATFDPSAIDSWGIIFNTGDTGSGTPGEVTFHVDSALLQPIN